MRKRTEKSHAGIQKVSIQIQINGNKEKIPADIQKQKGRGSETREEKQIKRQMEGKRI